MVSRDGEAQDSRQKSILVSGFEAFGGASINPTQRLVEAIQRGEIEIASAKVETILLPVEFKHASDKLHARIDELKPDVVLCLGQAGGRDAVELERIAVNLMDAEIADNSGFHPREIPIQERGENALFSTLPLQQMLADLKAAGVPARISNSAGLYVCNDLFYRLQAKRMTSGFVHFPYLPEQTTDKPSMPFAQMKLALETMLKSLQK